MRVLTSEEMGQVAGGCFRRRRSSSCWSWTNWCSSYTKPECSPEPEPVCTPEPECDPEPTCGSSTDDSTDPIDLPPVP